MTAAHLLALPAGAGASSMSSVGLTVGYMGLWLGEALRGEGPVIGWFTRWPCKSALYCSSLLPSISTAEEGTAALHCPVSYSAADKANALHYIQQT
jgi:hypothetical protein